MECIGWWAGKGIGEAGSARMSSMPCSDSRREAGQKLLAELEEAHRLQILVWPEVVGAVGAVQGP